MRILLIQFSLGGGERILLIQLSLGGGGVRILLNQFSPGGGERILLIQFSLGGGVRMPLFCLLYCLKLDCIFLAAHSSTSGSR